MPRYYLTFGYATPYRDSYQIIHAPDHHTARVLAFDEHKTRWAFLYDESEKAEAIDHYGLSPLLKELGAPGFPEGPEIIGVPV